MYLSRKEELLHLLIEFPFSNEESSRRTYCKIVFGIVGIDKYMYIVLIAIYDIEEFSAGLSSTDLTPVFLPRMK